MNLADWVIIAVIVASAMHAAAMGFFQEAFHIGGLIAGYLLAAWQYQRLGILLGTYLKSPWAADSAAFLIIFFAVTVAFGLAGRTARWVMKASGLRVVDRFLGALEGSEWAPYFQAVGRAAIWAAPSELRTRFYQGLELLRHPPQSPQIGSGKQSSGK